VIEGEQKSKEGKHRNDRILAVEKRPTVSRRSKLSKT
jgi:hypothetical protein